MGTSQSSQDTRTLQVDKEGVIEITGDVYKRLAGLPEEQRRGGGRGGGETLTDEQVAALRRQIENEYRQRIVDKSNENHRIKTEEFARAIQEVESKFLKQTGTPVCGDLQQEVYSCYQEHYKQPLRCSSQVKAFAQAVERERRNAFISSKNT
ncbi:MICOS complex subunit MIC19-like [Dreissena polymorpha]|uniref:MICOS complex subunit MIC19 n=1 Tax=Dreissena polymorpha TaxID=45954 RepID=A0A9D4MQ29_DREPO|nr:MICOS complex subunit MIC19-like [Dreissena polymorpha]KAH3881418.1 hypothetical protein DPMN_005345 [Dreissena polymorpha]